jgi:hypothetical protein
VLTELTLAKPLLALVESVLASTNCTAPVICSICRLYRVC